MKIGLINDLPMLESLNYLFSAFEDIRHKHETIYRPPEYLHASRIRREEMTRDLILKSDIIVGTTDEIFLETREKVGKHIPYLWFPFGSVTRGFPDLRKPLKYFKSTDIIVCHCEAEIEITERFFTNAQLRYVPFVYDDSIFYPLSEAARAQAKADLGFAPDDKILLYVGRITIEKNLTTLFRIFSVIQTLVPNVHLVIAGRTMENPFIEFGVFPVNMRNTLTKLYKNLGVPDEKVHFLGSKGPDELRTLYNVADVVSNLTLNHDENFGLAQVEAMGCGTPVVGTNWGGLKDTIVNGETGYKVSTFASAALGVKVDWWETLSRIVSLLNLNPAERAKLRSSSRDSMYERFSFAPYCRAMEAVLDDGLALRDNKSEPLELTPFGREFFQECVPMLGAMPSYKRTQRTYQLYRELITPYTGSTWERPEVSGRLSAGQWLCLVCPVRFNDDQTISVDDLISPLTIDVPAVHRETVFGTLEAMYEEPVIKVDRLTSVYLGGNARVLDSLLWMIDAGLIMKTSNAKGQVPLQNIGARMSTPLLTIQRANPFADALVFG
ncbi:MAG TPA: glycosyltransferase family 4 protein [Pyrinomonadaceae bacterium]